MVDLSPDPATAAEFYSDLFGWEVTEAGPPEAGGDRMCLLRGTSVAGLGVVTARGGKVHQPSMDTPKGRLALVADRTGRPSRLLRWRPWPTKFLAAIGRRVCRPPVGSWSSGEFRSSMIKGFGVFQRCRIRKPLIISTLFGQVRTQPS